MLLTNYFIIGYEYASKGLEDIREEFTEEIMNMGFNSVLRLLRKNS